jgi:CheY-like chemotaxis protein
MSAVSLPKKTVLVVEDNAEDVLLLEVAARTANCSFEMRFVHDGEEAIAYLKGDGQFADRKSNAFPDLVLLDLSLPKIDGIAVLEWIRATPECKHLTVFIWSGWNNPAALARTSKAGANRIIIKPVDASELVEIVMGMQQVLDADPSCPPQLEI